MSRDIQTDWTECDLIERVPGKMGGEPVIKGTRIEPDTIATNFELGSSADEIHENFPSVSLDNIGKLIAFVNKHQPIP